MPADSVGVFVPVLLAFAPCDRVAVPDAVPIAIGEPEVVSEEDAVFEGGAV